MKLYAVRLGLILAVGCAAAPPARTAAPTVATGVTPAPLAIGETFHLESKVLSERRVINVYLPPGYATSTERYPVLYMPDGGIGEDFPHVAGVIDVSIKNEVIRPLIVVGIENTERRRDLVGPTTIEKERTIAPHAGGADRFRTFLRTELKPHITAHYRVTAESAIVGESFAGLFVIETLLTEPTLFDAYIAVDPSLWWNDQTLVRSAAARFAAWSAGARKLYVASADDPAMQAGVAMLLAAAGEPKPGALTWHHLPLPHEHHNTIYPVAAVQAFRTLFAR
ncbi:MAG: esterase [Myxococcales bacterium]|nr:esterase [Myxococcales bacterium]